MKTAAFVFPALLIVFLVRHHPEHEDLLAGVQDASHKPVFVTANVEDHAIANEAGRRKVDAEVGP